MNKLLFCAVGLVALGVAVPAGAADLAARPYTKAPAMIAAVYDWSGFYVGANGGWGSSRKCWDLFTPAGLTPEGCHNATGGVAGGQVGYRWQTSAWVLGIEAQGDWADLRGSNISLLAAPFTNRSRIDAFGLFTGQVGYAWNNVLLYVKGGAAVTDDRFDVRSTIGDVLIATGDNQTRWGGTVGIGLEYGFVPNWSAALEYDRLFMQAKDTRFIDTRGGLLGIDRIRQDVDLVTVRVNYRWGGPVIAKY